MLRVTVKDGGRAFLMRNGRFEQVLEARAVTGCSTRCAARGRAAPGRARRGSGGAPCRAEAARPDLAAEMFEAVETKADRWRSSALTAVLRT
jgi:hypothetical protein